MNKVQLNSFNNSWYNPGSRLTIILWFIANRVFINTYFPIPSSFKRIVLNLFKPKISIKYPWLLEIQNDVWIGENVWIDNLSKVTIGSNVCISQGAMLLCGNHNYKKTTFDLMLGEIKLEEGVWIGAQSIVCPGVTCESHSVLSVGSIATSDLEAYHIYQGNPAVKIKSRSVEK